MRRITVVGVSAGLLVGLAGCGAGQPSTPSSSARSAPPASASYVHLGDSYAAGSGVTPLVEGSDLQCLRSQRNFGEIVAQRRGSQSPTFRDVSCAGASTSALFTAQYPGVAPQLDAVGAQTTLVTLSLGGNDGATFGTVISSCSDVAASDPGGAPCAARYGARFTDAVVDTTGPAMVRALAAIRAAAPRARVIVVGYPWVMPPTGGCYPTMRIASGDVPYLRRVQATLNRVVRAAAARTGATFVDLDEASSGHDACAGADKRWIEPMVGARTTVPVHPNASGQRALADATLSALGR